MTVVELCLLVRHFLRERRTWLIQATQRRDQRQGRTNGKRARTGGYITLICRAVWLILQSEPYPCSGRGLHPWSTVGVPRAPPASSTGSAGGSAAATLARVLLR